MHYVMAKGLLSSRNGMNLYRGCQHGCVYCDSRSKCYQMDHIFEDIEVKQNALELLERTLQSKRKPCMIGTGSMSDPYMPLEYELEMTRNSLELIYKYGFGVSVLTKSDRILRDLTLLMKINHRAKAVVQMTITTMNDSLCSIIEPNVCSTAKRIDALKIFQKAKIPTVVWLCPVLPDITDSQENIRSVVRACAECDVVGIVNFGMGLTLREGNREYYYNFLDRYYPGLKDQYIKRYGNAYELLSPDHKNLERIFHDDCEKYGILHDNGQIFRFMSEMSEKSEQLSLF